jgi:DNA-binding NtrC family response regulator
MPGVPSHGTVLIVEDNEGIVEVIQDLLRGHGYTVQSVITAKRAESVVKAGMRGVILLDLSLPDSQGLDLFERLKAEQPKNRIIIMTAYGELENVIGATAAGAFDFITKGGDLMERVRVTVRNAFESLAQEEQVAELASSILRRDRFARLISQSPQMDEVRADIDKLSHSRVNVLITGPSGTGKEVVSRTIHDAGPRHLQPFVAVNCAGIPDTLLESELFGYERGAFTGAVARKIGKFEAASGGTLFLDEIGEMSLTLQVKLLRVLQDGKFERLGGNTEIQPDARVITATNRDLLAMVKAGTFREDLYYRIAVFTLHLPPLTERKGDIPILVEHFVSAAAREEGKDIRGVAPEVMRLFELHPWPGNVRQLQNVVARSAVVCNTEMISLRDLPDSFVQELQQLHSAEAQSAAAKVNEERAQQPQAKSGTPAPALPPSLQRLHQGTVPERLDYVLAMAFPDDEVLPRVDDLEAAGIRLAMHRLGGNLQMTARRLNISRATLYRRLDTAQIHRGPTASTDEPSPVAD